MAVEEVGEEAAGRRAEARSSGAYSSITIVQRLPSAVSVAATSQAM